MDFYERTAVKRLLILCGTALLLVVPVAWAGNTHPLSFILYNAQISGSVSQQPGVTNTTECVWDASDYIDRIAGINSVLASGASVTDSWCVVEDSAAHVVTSQIASDSPSLVFTLSAGSASKQVVPVFDKRLNLWSYRGCVQVPTYSGPEVGQQVAASVTLANTDRRGAKVRYDWGVFPGVC